MKYSEGLVSERNLCDCGAGTKDEGKGKERKGGADREVVSSSGASALL